MGGLTIAKFTTLGLVPQRLANVSRELASSRVSVTSQQFVSYIHQSAPLYSLLSISSFLSITAMDTAKQAVAQAASTGKKLEKEVEQKLTYLWNEIPSWQQDNHYIRSGYRLPSNSFAKSFHSLSYLHNETVNIYTHLLGAVFAFISSAILYHVLAPRYETATREDIYVFSCFFLGAMTCLGMSATYHTIQNHSHEVAVWGNKLDYLGIVFLIWGSFVPVLYYGFQDEPLLMRRYWAMVRCFFLSVLGI